MSRSLRFIVKLALVFLALAVLGGLVWANTLYTRIRPIEKQFLLPWLGARTFLQYGVSPYDDQATQRAQVVFYGRLAAEDEDPLRLSVLFPAELIYFPFALITDYQLARGLWMTFGEIALVTTVLLCLSLTEWKPRRLLLLFVLFFFIFWIYSFSPLSNSSPAPLVALGLVGSLAALRRENDELAGALLAISLLEPAIAALFLLFMLWWTITSRRWRTWWGFVMATAFFIIISFLLLPSWFVPFSRNVISQIHYNSGISVSGLLADWWPAIGLKLSLILTIALGLVLFLEWRTLRGKDFRHGLWVASLTITAAPLVGLPTSLDGHILLFLPITLLFAVAAERWRSSRAAFASGGLLVGIFLLFWLVSGSIHALFLILPFLLFGGLYWMRWWSVNPPRTWSDVIRK